jgi:hypothetical protein
VGSPNPKTVELNFDGAPEVAADIWVEVNYGRQMEITQDEANMLLGHWEPAGWDKIPALKL